MATRSRAQMGRKKNAETAAAAVAVAEKKTVDATTAAASSLTSVVDRAQQRARSARDRLPDLARFGLALLLNFSLSSVSEAGLKWLTQDELTSIARESDSMLGTIVSAGWKIFLLTLGWFGDYDGYDLASLALLSHGPTAYLLSVFYGIRPLTAGVYLVSNVVSYFVPFLLFRELSGAHSAAPGTPNREIVIDRGIQVLTSILAGLVYNVVLFLACHTFLPTTLVLHFVDIPTVEPATDAVLLGLGRRPDMLVLSLLFGIAARTFIFTPLVTTPQTAEDEQSADFDPVSATLGQTVAWNLWGYTTQTKVSIKRTAAAVLATAVSTYLQCTLTIRGVESLGAAVWAGVWATATLATGLSLRYVGSI
ncbi:hypothetical protein V8F06_000791 [Rhypophila decipiens]